jgi:hypothetical protein
VASAKPSNPGRATNWVPYPIHKALPGFFLCIFSSLTCLNKPVLRKPDLLTSGKYPASVTISKKWKNPSSALCRKRTCIQVLPWFSICSLKSQKGLYSGPSPIRIDLFKFAGPYNLFKLRFC